MQIIEQLCKHQNHIIKVFVSNLSYLCLPVKYTIAIIIAIGLYTSACIGGLYNVDTTKLGTLLSGSITQYFYS